jgi:hypothetical protein
LWILVCSIKRYCELIGGVNFLRPTPVKSGSWGVRTIYRWWKWEWLRTITMYYRLIWDCVLSSLPTHGVPFLALTVGRLADSHWGVWQHCAQLTCWHDATGVRSLYYQSVS